MITKRMNAYYCEHCGKRYFSKRWINKHEPACTLNPVRHCGMCGQDQPVQTEPFAKFLEPAPQGWLGDDLPKSGIAIRQVIEGQYDAFIAEVHDSVNGCPPCMLAIIRQLHIKRIPWDYSAEKDNWWAAIREDEEKMERTCYGYGF